MRTRRAALVARPLWLIATLALLFIAAQRGQIEPTLQNSGVATRLSSTLVVADSTDASTIAPPIRIGGIFSIGPSLGPAGRQQWEASRLAIQEINASGGVLDPSGRRRTVEFVSYEDEGRPDLAATIARRLSREDDVVAILGLSDPATAAAAVAVAERENLPIIALTMPERDQARTAPRWTFTLDHSQIDALTVVLETISGSQAERLGWIAPRTLVAEVARTHLVQDAENRGLRVVAEESYSLLEQDLGERLARLAAAGADAIVGWPRGPEDAATIARAMGRAQRTRLYLGPPAATDTFLTIAGDSALGIRVPVTRLLVADDLWDHDPLTPPIRELVRTFHLAHGHLPGVTAAAAWDATRLVLAAVERGGTDRARVREALERTAGFSGASGPIDFAADDHDGLDRRAPLVGRIVVGGWRIPP
jgi:branched-chain amino acid transport system substrate-binding protein